MKHRWVSIWQVLLTLMATQTYASGEMNDGLRAQFLAAASEVASKGAYVSLRLRYTTTVDYPIVSASKRVQSPKTNFEKPKTVVEEFAFRGPMSLSIQTSARGIEQVQCKNTEYAFQVNRPSSAKDYSLTFVEQLGGNSDSAGMIRNTEVMARGRLLGGWYLYGTPLNDLIASPTFRIQRIAEEVRGDGRVVRIDFTWVAKDARGSYQRENRDAFITCDPGRDWAITEYGSTVDLGTLLRGAVEYGRTIDGVPLVRRHSETRTFTDQKGDKTVWRAVSEVEIVEEDVPRVEFYLSHYGLPEPTFKKNWLGRWAWYLAAGIVCVGSSVILLWRRRVAR